MRTGMSTFQGGRLTEARMARGVTKTKLAAHIDVSKNMIGHYESGTNKPTKDKVSALALALNFSVDFFTRPIWSESIPVVHWRSRAAVSKRAREMTEPRMLWMCELFEHLSRSVDFGDQTIPSVDVPHDFHLITSEHIESAAEELRRSWGVGTEPIPDMLLALENMGIPTSHFPIASDKQDGFTFYSRPLKRHFVGVNADTATACRGRLDAAHELAHIVLHRNVTPSEASDVVNHKLLEQQAFHFAGAILFPREAFYREVEYVSLSYFCELKNRWKMSIAAMIMRAADLGLIDSEAKRALFTGMVQRNWRGPRREPYDDVIEMEQPRMLRRGIEVMLDGGVFSLDAFRSALTQPVEDLERMIGLEPGLLRKKSIDELIRALRGEDRGTVDLETGAVVSFSRR